MRRASRAVVRATPRGEPGHRANAGVAADLEHPAGGREALEIVAPGRPLPDAVHAFHRYRETEAASWERREAELRRSEAVARAASIGALTASIAHEVNQPLTGIVTSASTCLRMLMSDPPDVEGARETARRAIRDANRAADVISRVRALLSGKPPAAEPVDLNEAAREVVALSRGELRRGRVAARLELAGELPLVVGDRVQLQQVIINLVRNAFEAMGGVEDRPQEIVIRTARDGDDRVRLSVRDSGVGFAPGEAERLFDAFHTTKPDGMGIGLSVSRSIIESHRGRLWAVPNDGPGATFAFSLPRGSPSALAAARSD
ncbi:MAG TPA: ATP-binding protein [Longimicrobium sp.]|nr:ATP-binding protein [Longimicrobium sp.]